MSQMEPFPQDVASGESRGLETQLKTDIAAKLSRIGADWRCPGTGVCKFTPRALPSPLPAFEQPSG